MTKLQESMKKMGELLKPEYDLTKVHPQYFTDKNNGLDVSPSDYPYPYDKPKHEMPTLKGFEEWPNDYVLSESHIKPVEATPIELGYEIDRLERQVAFEQETKLAINRDFFDYLEKYRKLEIDFENRGTEIKKLEAKLNKLEGTEQYSLWLMKQHLQMKEQLASVEDKGEVNNQWR